MVHVRAYVSCTSSFSHRGGGDSGMGLSDSSIPPLPAPRYFSEGDCGIYQSSKKSEAYIWTSRLLSYHITLEMLLKSPHLQTLKPFPPFMVRFNPTSSRKPSLTIPAQVPVPPLASRKPAPLTLHLMPYALIREAGQSGSEGCTQIQCA